MSQQHLTIGAADAGGGMVPFDAFTAIEANFDELYAASVTPFTETAVVYVDAAGNNSTGLLGRADKPFLTITAALAAGVAVTSLRIKIGMGTFASPATANLRANLWLEGAGKPGYNNTVTQTAFAAVTITDPTALIGGTILQGVLFFQDKSNVHLTDLGVDCGSAYVTGGGTEGNQIAFLSATIVAPWVLMTNIVIKNVTTLGRTAGSAFHGIQIENGFKFLIENCDTYFSTHGIVAKSYGGIINNVRCNFHTADAIILKTDTYAFGWNTQINNFEVQGGGGVYINIGTGTSSGGIAAMISNGVMRSPTFGIKVSSGTTSKIAYFIIHNIRIYGSSGIGFEVEESQSSILTNCTAIVCTTGFLITTAGGDNMSQVYNSFAESCTTGFNIVGGGNGAILRNCMARANTTGYTFSGVVYASGLVNDTNGTNFSGSVFPISIERGKFFFGSTGVVAPSAIVQLVAGTTTAATAPLKFTSGTSMTAAEAGAVEFTTDDLFFTITTGAARKRVLLSDATGGLTSGAVPIATTNGRLADSAITLTTLVRVLTTDTTTTGNVTTGEDTLQTYSLPAATLGTNGNSVRGRISGTVENNANSKTFRLKFGGTTFMTRATTTPTIGQGWTIDFEIIRTAATTQKCNATFSGSDGIASSFYATAGETLSGAINIVLTGDATATNDIVKETFKVVYES